MKKSIIQAVMMNGLSLSSRRNNTFILSPGQLAQCPHHSRGKSGKQSSTRSNAATFKRASKKRKNVLKHK